MKSYTFSDVLSAMEACTHLKRRFERSNPEQINMPFNEVFTELWDETILASFEVPLICEEYVYFFIDNLRDYLSNRINIMFDNAYNCGLTRCADDYRPYGSPQHPTSFDSRKNLIAMSKCLKPRTIKIAVKKFMKDEGWS